MPIESFRDKARSILNDMLDEKFSEDREQFVEAYVDVLTQIHASETHALLTEVIEDARTRLDARLSPDPIRQTIANVQTTVQDIWHSLWRD